MQSIEARTQVGNSVEAIITSLSPHEKGEMLFALLLERDPAKAEQIICESMQETDNEKALTSRHYDDDIPPVEIADVIKWAKCLSLGQLAEIINQKLRTQDRDSLLVELAETGYKARQRARILAWALRVAQSFVHLTTHPPAKRGACDRALVAENKHLVDLFWKHSQQMEDLRVGSITPARRRQDVQHALQLAGQGTR